MIKVYYPLTYKDYREFAGRTLLDYYTSIVEWAYNPQCFINALCLNDYTISDVTALVHSEIFIQQLRIAIGEGVILTDFIEVYVILDGKKERLRISETGEILNEEAAYKMWSQSVIDRQLEELLTLGSKK